VQKLQEVCFCKTGAANGCHFITVRNNLALSVFFVLFDGVSTGPVVVAFKPVPVRESNLGRLSRYGLIVDGLALMPKSTPESASEMDWEQLVVAVELKLMEESGRNLAFSEAGVEVINLAKLGAPAIFTPAASQASLVVKATSSVVTIS
jgi:hypothetical protein